MAHDSKQSHANPAASMGGAQQQGTEIEERRASDRHAFTATAQVLDLRSQTRVAGRISDLGPSGCYIDTISPLSAGSSVSLRIQHAEREFVDQAQVSFAHPSMGMGLAFTDITPEHQAILSSWIAALQGVRAEPQGAEPAPPLQASPPQKILRELINLMVRKKLINGAEALELLRLLPR